MYIEYIKVNNRMLNTMYRDCTIWDRIYKKSLLGSLNVDCKGKGERVGNTITAVCKTRIYTLLGISYKTNNKIHRF